MSNSFLYWLNDNFNLLRKVHTLNGMAKQEVRWKPPLEVSDKATIEELKFVFDQATKRVEQTAKEGDDFYQKGIGIISIALPVLSALIGYIASNFKFSPQIFGAIPVSIILWRVLSKLKNIVIPKRYLGSGSSPETLVIKDFYENLEQNKTPEWYMLMSEIIMYQDRLDINMLNNKVRKDKLIECYNLLYSIPIVVIVAIAIYYLIYSLNP
ncbi:MAG TPA: hypothetical protein VK543_14855 [Puia sp.]|nr:hypothetical protein [Puia sp.]